MSLIKFEKVSYEKVNGMMDKLVIRKNGMVVMIVGMDKLRSKEKDNKKWYEGKLMYCVVKKLVCKDILI